MCVRVPCTHKWYNEGMAESQHQIKFTADFSEFRESARRVSEALAYENRDLDPLKWDAFVDFNGLGDDGTYYGSIEVPLTNAYHLKASPVDGTLVTAYDGEELEGVARLTSFWVGNEGTLYADIKFLLETVKPRDLSDEA